MHRMSICLAGLALLALAPPAHSESPIAASLFSEPTDDARILAKRAYVWGMPLVEAARIRERFTSTAQDGDVPGQPLNQFKHRRKLSGPEMKAGVGPNNDTVYSLAWVDLADGPLVITAPDFGERYYTFSINLADSSGEQSLGQRTHGGQLPPMFLHGPGHDGAVPAGMVSVPSPTRYVNVAGRILVRGPEEYAQVGALQDRLQIHSWKDWQAGRRDPAPAGRQIEMETGPVGASEADAFYYRLGSVLRDWHVRPEERPIIASLAGIGLSPEHGFRPETLSPAQRAALAQGHAEGKALVAQASLQLGVQQNGWTTNYRGPRFGTDYLLRAAVAKDQIYVAIPEEAIYPIGRIDATGQPLTGKEAYRIRFAPDALPPVDAFWSITAYDDQGAMIPNPIDRYSVGDRTPGLVRDADGSVTIWLSATPPSPASGGNWLPVAPGAPFYLMMRLYQPKAELLEQRWSPPAIERMTDTIR